MVKRFVAPTWDEALKQVKSDLGPEAVVLFTRTVKKGSILGLGGKNWVEVTASNNRDVIDKYLKKGGVAHRGDDGSFVIDGEARLNAIRERYTKFTQNQSSEGSNGPAPSRDELQTGLKNLKHSIEAASGKSEVMWESAEPATPISKSVETKDDSPPKNIVYGRSKGTSALRVNPAPKKEETSKRTEESGRASGKSEIRKESARVDAAKTEVANEKPKTDGKLEPRSAGIAPRDDFEARIDSIFENLSPRSIAPPPPEEPEGIEPARIAKPLKLGGSWKPEETSEFAAISEAVEDDFDSLTREIERDFNRILTDQFGIEPANEISKSELRPAIEKTVGDEDERPIDDLSDRHSHLRSDEIEIKVENDEDDVLSEMMEITARESGRLDLIEPMRENPLESLGSLAEVKPSESKLRKKKVESLTDAFHLGMLELSEAISSNISDQPRPNWKGMTQEMLEVYYHLISQEMPRDLAQNIVKKLRDELRTGGKRTGLRDQVVSKISGYFRTTGGISHRLGETKVVALVGPTGAGKSVTSFKLADSISRASNASVGIVQVEVNSKSKLRASGIKPDGTTFPFHVACTGRQLQAALASLSGCDAIIVDFGGCSPKKAVDMSELGRLLDIAAPDETHLVVPANVRSSLLVDSARRFLSLNIDRLILTKLDESGALGSLLSFFQQVRKGISYVTYGQSRTGELEIADPQRIAKLILGYEKV
ncbi:MAG: hypothetical protein NUW37_07995 [Planctomycetes bacterium]|nr:hypothetical protein [Planctomycetota bacterium]